MVRPPDEGLHSTFTGGKLSRLVLIWLIAILTGCAWPASSAEPGRSRDSLPPVVTTPAATVPTGAASPRLGAASDLTTTKSEIERLSDELAAWRSIIINVLLLGLLVAFLRAGVWEFRRRSILVEPIDVPKDLMERGLSSAAVAQRVIAEISAIRRDARTRSWRQEETFELGGTQLDFVVPAAGISYRGLIQYAQQYFGRLPQRVRGEIEYSIAPNDAPAGGSQNVQGTSISLRTLDGRTTSNKLVITSDGKLPELVKKAAFELAELVDPYLIVSYWFSQEQQGRSFDKTLESLRTCLSRASAKEHYRAYNAWGNVLASQFRFPEAEEKYLTSLALAPRTPWHSAPILNSLGNLKRSTRQIDDAAASYGKSIRRNPRYFYAWSNLGYVCHDRRMFRCSIPYFRRAIWLEPRFEAAWNGLGFSLWKLGRIHEAEGKFARAADLDPSYPWAYINWARLLAEQFRYEEAIGKLLAGTRLASASSDAFAALGDLYVRSGHFDKAEEAFGTADALNPLAGIKFAGLAFSCIQQRRHADAIAAAERALALNRYHIGARLRWAEALRRTRRNKDAIDKYEEIIALDPYQVDAYSGWGEVLRRQHKYPDAIEKFRAATLIDPRATWPLRGWGQTLMDMRQYEAAIRKFRKALRVNSYDAFAYGMLGQALRALGRRDEALAEIQRGCELDQRGAWIWGEFAHALADVGRRDEAISKLRSVAERSQDRVAMLIELGRVQLYWMRRPADAVETLELALTQASRRADALQLRAAALDRLGRKREAIDLLRNAVAIEPWDDGAVAALGRLLSRENPEEAIQLFESVRQQAVESVSILVEWGNTLRQLRCTAAALGKYGAAIELDPYDPSAHLAYGRLLRESGKYSAAISEFRQAAKRDSRNSWAKLEWGRSLAAMKRYPSAIRKFKSAIEIDPSSEFPYKDWGDALKAMGREAEAAQVLDKWALAKSSMTN